MMKKVLVAGLALAVTLTMGLLVVSRAASTITVYADDRPGWESAVACGYDEEFFTDATLNPGVSVDSDYPGHVDTTRGVWWDRLVCPAYGLTTTTWQFDPPIVGFGGNWNPGIPGGPGARIAVAINGSWVSVGEIPNHYTGEFWGFVSTVPFSQVRLEPGSWCAPGGGAWCETYELDNMVYSGVCPVDIRPGSCPNPFNTKSKGVLPVAVLGTEDFDVTTVDPATIKLTREGYEAGVSPLRWSYEDTATPFEGELCECHDLNGDGHVDLTLKFDTQEVKGTLHLDGEAGNTVPLLLTGSLKEEAGGTPIEGSDCVWVVQTGKK
jgi:hypothetical protein